MVKSSRNFLLLLFLFLFNATFAQDKRAQYPSFIGNRMYTEVTAGYINFPFSDKNLLPGFTTQKIIRPFVGVRLGVLGYKFNENISVQVNYMRPVLWVYYRNVNNDDVQHTVTVNITSIQLRARMYWKNWCIYGEAGPGLMIRSGFYVNAPHVLNDASYGTLVAGAGLQYKRSKKWSLTAGAGWVPKRDKQHQPSSLFITAGFQYSIQQLTAEKINAVRNSPYFFPKHILQIGYTTDWLGFGTNDFFANKIVPVFWGGDVEVHRGFSVSYQRNFFHTRKVFSMDWGISMGAWQSRRQGTNFYTASIFPLFRFNFLRKKKIDMYFNYSVAGPSFISETRMDDVELGEKFTFQDFMGAGIFAGKKRNLNAELRILHFSNGGLFPKNNGVKVPITFIAGYAF